MLTNILSCCILLLIGVRLIQGSPPPYKSQYSIRRTKSEEMLKYMNTSLGPCDDFAKYTCANYAKYYADVLTEITNVGITELMSKEMSSKIKLELKTDNASDGVAERKVKKFYKSCLSESKLTDAYRDKLKAQIREYGKMPVLEGENWRESDFDWVNTVAKININTHVPIIIDISVTPDLMDNTILRARIVGAEFEANKNLYVDEQFKNEMETFKQRVALDLHTFLNVTGKLALRTAEEIINFEIGLAHGLMNPLTTTSFTDIFVITPIEEVQRKYASLWDTKNLMINGLGFAPSELMIEHSYLENAFSVIQKTPKKVLANYIFYKYLKQFMKEFAETSAEQENDCLDITRKHFIRNLENMMHRKYFTEHDKQSLYAMWDELKSSFKEVIESPKLNWLQETTRKEALAKIKNIKFEISAYEADDFDQRLSGIDIDEFDYIQNIHSLLILQGNEATAKIYEPPTPDAEELMLSSSPAYSPTENAVYVPVFFLQPYKFYSPSYPRAFNYAGLGFVIAHELIHGFDDKNSNFDANGNARNWWDPQSTRVFKERIKCLKNQYKKYTYGGHSLPEMNKQSENIADNGGIRLAYQAYLKWYERTSKMNQKMEWFPDMDYSPKQLFFISFGHLWCAATNPSHIAQMLYTDGHVPDMLRVTGSLSNFDEFSREFYCPRGSGMNPIQKCEIY